MQLLSTTFEQHAMHLQIKPPHALKLAPKLFLKHLHEFSIAQVCLPPHHLNSLQFAAIPFKEAHAPVLWQLSQIPNQQSIAVVML
jgi:hypothetical protein